MILYQWAKDYGIPPHAIADLQRRMHSEYTPPLGQEGSLSEAAVQTNIRLEASKSGVLLWRNNVGALVDRATS